MSDPMQNIEIEDILSSIRRLVASGDNADEPGSGTQGGKLLLTEAFRVPPKQDTDSSDSDAPAETDTSLQETAHPQPVVAAPSDDLVQSDHFHPRSSGAERDAWEEISLEERIAELEAAVARTEEEWEPDGSEVVRSAQNYEDLQEALAGHVAEDAPQDIAPPEAAAAELVEDDTDSSGDLPIIEFSVGLSAQQADVPEEPDAPQQETAESAAPDDQSDAGAAEIAEEPAGADADIPVAQSSTDEPEVQANRFALFLTSQVRPEPVSEDEAEPAEGNDAEAQQDAWASDTAPDAAFSRSGISFGTAGDTSMEAPPEEENPAEADTDPQAMSAQPSDTDTPPNDDAAIEDDPWQLGTPPETMEIDEDALRELVVEIVREELQGNLGDRITRNVRKLVRREVNRALSSRELD